MLIDRKKEHKKTPFLGIIKSRKGVLNVNIIVIYKDLPPRAKAFTRANADGSYTIIINARHCWETQKAAYLEELKHIRGNDFDLDLQVNLIEEMRHRELMSSQKEKKESNNSINFNEWSG